MANNDALYAVADLVLQFAYRSKYYNAEALDDGGLSALENAFYVLETNGCKVNRNGTIQLSNLLRFMDELEKDENAQGD